MVKKRSDAARAAEAAAKLEAMRAAENARAEDEQRRIAEAAERAAFSTSRIMALLSPIVRAPSLSSSSVIA